MRAKLESVLRALRSGRSALDEGQEKMRNTRQEVVADWRATADALRRRGEADLAAQVAHFVARMPDVQTEAQRLADHWNERTRYRVLDR
jgi:hypothetical protein